jgi:deazaflavin-dependent oxidoreductase (nitroreductase family)
MAQAQQHFVRPSLTERIFNRLFAIAIGLGIGLAHNYVVEVRGRKSGRMFSTPIDLLEAGGRRYLVAPRGETNWVLNARAAGRVTLRKGHWSEEVAVREVGPAARPELLKAYLGRFALTVQRYFPIVRGSPASEFAPIAERYPVFELITLEVRSARA